MRVRPRLTSRLFAPRVIGSGRRIQVEIPPKQVIRTVLLTCAVLLGLLVVWLAQEVIFLLLLAILLSTVQTVASRGIRALRKRTAPAADSASVSWLLD